MNPHRSHRLPRDAFSRWQEQNANVASRLSAARRMWYPMCWVRAGPMTRCQRPSERSTSHIARCAKVRSTKAASAAPSKVPSAPGGRSGHGSAPQPVEHSTGEGAHDAAGGSDAVGTGGHTGQAPPSRVRPLCAAADALGGSGAALTAAPPRLGLPRTRRLARTSSGSVCRFVCHHLARTAFFPLESRGYHDAS